MKFHGMPLQSVHLHAVRMHKLLSANPNDLANRFEFEKPEWQCLMVSFDEEIKKTFNADYSAIGEFTNSFLTNNLGEHLTILEPALCYLLAIAGEDPEPSWVHNSIRNWGGFDFSTTLQEPEQCLLEHQWQCFQNLLEIEFPLDAIPRRFNFYTVSNATKYEQKAKITKSEKNFLPMLSMVLI